MERKRNGYIYQIVRIVMVIVCVSVVAATGIRSRNTKKIYYSDHRDDVAVTIDGTKYLFRDLAFYLAYQEMQIEEQAKVYDLEHPEKYWNLYINDSFIRVTGRDMAMDMALHDMIFYDLAQKTELQLSQEEYSYVENQKNDFWNDIDLEGQIRLGVGEAEITEDFEKMALAQKAQQILAETEGVDYRAYNVEGDGYAALLEQHTYKINEKLWNRLRFGSVIYQY